MSRMLWIGSYTDDATFKKMQKFGYRNSAAHVSQKNILEGIEKVTGNKFDSIGCLVLPDYPACKTLCVKKQLFHHQKDVNDVLVGYLNIKYLNRLFSKHGLKREANKWAKTRSIEEEHVDIFVYEMRSACLAAAIGVKKRIPGSKIHLIVPDLPQYMSLSMSKIKKVLKNIDWKAINRALLKVDDFILYSAPMAEFLKIQNRPWMVMEGSISVEEIQKTPAKQDIDNDKVSVMYSGYLDRNYGIDKLVSAFEFLDDKYELWITGSGPAENIVKEAAARDNRIKFFGFLNSREDLISLQQKATMLINMRDPNVQASDYCFPSKIFEYMLTGKPVLSCKLGGIPEEYFDCLIQIRSFSSEDIATAIKEIGTISKEEKNKIGEKNKQFIISKKNNIEQAKKIVYFIEI